MQDFNKEELKAALAVVEEVFEHFRKERLLNKEEMLGADALVGYIELMLGAN